MEEFDIEQNVSHDLAGEGLQNQLLQKLRSGLVDALVTTPPCSTFSRVRAANMKGPPPVRSRDHLWGFPWLFGQLKQDVMVGNSLVVFSVEMLEAAQEVQLSTNGVPIRTFMEHPEDLGGACREEDGAWFVPASIWQWDRLQRLVEAIEFANFTVVFHQCCWGAPWRKPTRILSNLPQLRHWGFQGWPTFDEHFVYQGPLQVACSCVISSTLAKKSNKEQFRTTGTSQYPAAMDRALAMAFLETFLADCNNLSSTVGDGKSSSQEKVIITEKEEKADKKEHEEEQERGTELQIPTTVRASQGGSSRWDAPRPLQAYYKGVHRGIHDGGGLKSPGRWPVDKRPPIWSQKAADLGAHCKKLFLRWLLEREAEKKGSAEATFWKLAAGGWQSSPFGAGMVELREKLDEVLAAQGFDPYRKDSDRVTEINFRRLRAVLQSLGDEDHSYLEEMATSGVSLGVDETMPRTPEVFEEKTKWAREFTDEVLEDKMADN